MRAMRFQASNVDQESKEGAWNNTKTSKQSGTQQAMGEHPPRFSQSVSQPVSQSVFSQRGHYRSEVLSPPPSTSGNHTGECKEELHEHGTDSMSKVLYTHAAERRTTRQHDHSHYRMHPLLHLPLLLLQDCSPSPEPNTVESQLLRSGDVERNPGPPTPPSTDRCHNPQCNKIFNYRAKPMECVKCLHRFHRSTCTHLSKRHIEKLVKTMKDFVCNECDNSPQPEQTYLHCPNQQALPRSPHPH